ncbi:MAG: histidine kinase, partial [Comamonas sp.]
MGAVHAAKELPGASTRPAHGWEPVTLPDNWTTHWPGYSGVVWYRIRLNQDCTAAQEAREPVALLAMSINMAGEVYLNDTLLWRDASLQPPRSRSWNTPRYWILPQAAMQTAGNAIWIRIHGEALVQPGLGTIRIGAAAPLLALHEQFVWSNRTIFKINMIGTLFITALFSGIWLLNRKQSVHGWFAALNLAWAVFIYNVIATDHWPFQEAASVARFNAIAFMVFCSCYCIFIFELQGRALPQRLQRGLLTLTLAMSLLVALIAEKHLEATLSLGTISHMLAFTIASIAPLVYAWRSRSIKGLLPALPGLVTLGIAVHDLIIYLRNTPEPVTLAPYTSLLTMIVITGVLGARIAASMRRTERFNVEL